MLLESKGFEVDTAENGLRPWSCSANPGYYDAILMDIRMPLMDGPDGGQQHPASEQRGCAHDADHRHDGQRL